MEEGLYEPWMRRVFAVSTLWVPVCLFVCCQLFPKHPKTAYRRFGAWVWYKVMRGVHEKCKPQKTELFKAFDLIPDKTGPRVLEIGVGPGSNLGWLPSDCRLTCLEPNPQSRPYVERALRKHPGITLAAFVQGFAEDMRAFRSETFDAVVLTFTLCSVRSPDRALREIRRVLKPGGVFCFLEIVAAPANSGHRLLQDAVEHVWPVLLDNCHVDRDLGASIQRAGFAKVNLNHCRINVLGLPFLSFGLYGHAVK